MFFSSPSIPLRADSLSCYNPDSVQTPNIDKLAAKGVKFTSAFAHNPLTLPSHANILLGTTPPYHGVHTNANFVVEDWHTTLAEHLKMLNYSTAAFVSGATLDSRFGLDQGFDTYDDTFETLGLHKFERAERKAEEVVQAALSWLKSQNDLWFAWIHLFDPHYPYEPPSPYHQDYAGHPYDGEVAYTDFELGKVFDYLQKNRLDQNTLVILTADHGESLGEHGEQTHGFFAYNATLWVPLIIFFPGIQPGVRTDPVAHTDIFPTVCDLLGTAKPSILQGLSLNASLHGEKIPERQIYFESLDSYFSEGWAPLRGYLSGNLKYIDSPIPEVYDLSTDFSEKTNIASRKNPEIFKQNLTILLDRFSSGGRGTAQSKLNAEMLEKLRSLGYTAGSAQSPKEEFGPEDDIKTKMPVYNSVIDAFSLKDKGAVTQGITALEEICEKSNTLPTAFYYLAKLYRETGKVDRSLETLQAGMEKFPQHFDLLLEYVDSLIIKGDFQTLIKTATSKNLPQMEQDASFYNKLALAYSKTNQLDKALEILHKAAAVDDGYADVFQNIGSIYLSRFYVSKEIREYKMAEENFSKVLSIDTNRADAHNSLGSLYFSNGNVDKAIESWEKAAQLSDDLGMTYYFLGLVYLSKNMKDKALFYFISYKSKYYNFLTEQEKQKLERLIVLCR